MSRDLALYFSNKLAGEWSASSVTGLLTSEVVEDISTTRKWEALDPLVRVRVLLAPMFLRRQELAELRSALNQLKATATNDNDEWVRVMAAAVGSYDGILHMDAVIEHSKLVKATLEETKRHAAGADPTDFRPLEEKYLSHVVMERRLPGLTAERNHIPPHTHFTLRDPSQAPGATPAVPSSTVPPPPMKTSLKGTAIGTAGGTTSAIANATTLAGAGFRVGNLSSSSRPSSAGGDGSSGLGRPPPGLVGKPPIIPPRGSLRKPDEGNLFMSSRRTPLAGVGSASSGGGGSAPGGGSGLLARLGGGGSAGGSRFAPKKKKAAVLDISTVAELNQATMAQRQQAQREQEEAREAAAQARAEARKAEKEAREDKKKRETARLAAQAAALREAAKAEREAEKEKKEKDALAAKEAREMAKLAKESEKARKEAEYKAIRDEAARRKTEELAEKEAQRAKREAERAEKETAKAARAELKRTAAAAAAGDRGGPSRPAKAAKTSAGATPSALATVQSLMESNVLERGAPREAPLVQLIDPEVALAALREAQSLGEGGFYGGDQEQEQYDADVLRYIEMGRAAGSGGGDGQGPPHGNGDKG